MTEREEREVAATLAHRSTVVPEKTDTRDECRECYYARVRREEDEQKRLGFLEGRDRGRPQRGLFSRGKPTGPLAAGGVGGGPLSGGEGYAAGDG